MKTLTAENVSAIFMDCLFQNGEDTARAVVAEGIINKFGFHPERLESHKESIGEMLACLPDGFQSDKGGGMSFLNACVTRDNGQWGEHQNMEQLFVLGVASGQAKSLMPREMWKMLPGGMPYFVVVSKQAAVV